MSWSSSSLEPLIMLHHNGGKTFIQYEGSPLPLQLCPDIEKECFLSIGYMV